MFRLFGRKKTDGKPKAIAFVDYEHWYISLDKLFGNMRPDIKAWRDALSEKYEMEEIIFFADFSNPALRQEIPRIREVSNYIIETQNTSTSFKKDFTDFIMLDHIYQKAMKSKDIGTFILFSGDGHFNSVCSFLISQLGKKVGVYAIRGAMSNQLKNTASWVELLPEIVDPYLDAYRLILKNLKYLEENKAKKSYPTFWATVESVSRFNRIRRKDVATALHSMIDKGYVVQKEVDFGGGKIIQSISVDWKKCRADGIDAD